MTFRSSRASTALRARLLGGWQVSGITSFLSGQSFSLAQPHDPWDPNGLNVGLGISSPRPDQIAAVQKTKTVGAWFSQSSFAPGPQPLRQRKQWQPARPGYNDWDLAAIKNIAIQERYSFQLRGEFFNAFNHESFSGVDSSLADSSFGQVTCRPLAASHPTRREVHLLIRKLHHSPDQAGAFAPALFLYAVHDRQLGVVSPLHILMVVWEGRGREAFPLSRFAISAVPTVGVQLPRVNLHPSSGWIEGALCGFREALAHC